MTRPRILAAILGLSLIGASAPAFAQSTIIVPAPGPAPTTVITPSQSGTTVVVPPGSTVTVQPPPVTTTAVVPVRPWCAGEYGTPGGTNFGSCPGNLPR
ncbi:MAG TPA: hypothetical protein VGQ77_13425 [Methylomirabilota bacterium]|jgi:hypothetical protein|nr:hypothetical protein [Methylomirabilota bacterium]